MPIKTIPTKRGTVLLVAEMNEYLVYLVTHRGAQEFRHRYTDYLKAADYALKIARV